MQPSSYKKNKRRLCDPTGWWWSIKYDGMKARWIDGTLLTRSGNTIPTPEWFMKLLPQADIEGELYFGLNTFHKTATLRSHSISENTWKKVQFLVFDLIDYDLCWFDRQQKLFDLNLSYPIKLVKWYKIKSGEHLESRYDRVVKQGEEGVIIANPMGMYINGRVTHILKYKAINDCEAIIVGYNTNDSGNRLASFVVCPLGNKHLRFNIGTGLKMKNRFNYLEQFPIGTIIRYSYEVMGKSGKPRTPIFQGIRVDAKCK